MLENSITDSLYSLAPFQELLQDNIGDHIMWTFSWLNGIFCGTVHSSLARTLGPFPRAKRMFRTEASPAFNDYTPLIFLASTPPSANGPQVRRNEVQAPW